MTTQNLKRKVIHSVGWSFSSQMSREILQFIVSIILARLLMPKDYGLIGMSGAIIGFVQIFNTLGFRSSLIQKQDVSEKHFSTAFWSTLLVSVVLYLVTVILSPLAVMFFKEPLLKGIIIVSSSGFIISALSTIQFAIMEKHLDFKKITLIELVTSVFSGIVSVTMAVKGYGVWSIVWGSVIGQTLAAPLPWLMSSWRPELRFDKDAFKELFGFGAHLTGANLVNYFARNADNLIIGKILGASALGYYALAYNLMLKPLSYVSSNIARVLFPAFSTIKNDMEKTRNVYLKVVQYISVITFPMMTGLLFIAPEMIVAIYGAKWSPVVPIFQVLCLLGAIQSIGTTVGTIYMSQGRADLQFKYTLIFTPIIVTSFFVGVRWGVTGVAIAYVIASGSIWIWSHVVANRLIDLKLRFLFAQMYPAFLASSGMFVCLTGIRYLQMRFLPVAQTEIALLIEFIVLGVIIYSILLYAIKGKELKELLKVYRSNYA